MRGKYDQGTQKLLIIFGRAGNEVGIGEGIDEWDQKFIFVPNRLDLVIGVEDFALIQA